MHSQCHRTSAVLLVVAAAAGIALLPIAVRAQGARTAPGIRYVLPSLDLSWTSGAADPLGDGAGMSGVGLDLLVRAGAEGMLGPFHVRFVPEFALNENRDRQTFPSGDASRNAFASPYYFGDFSADLPTRPGADAHMDAVFGESGVWWTGRHAFVGALSSTPDWGPGGAALSPGVADGTPSFGEGLVFGRSAPGVPRLEAAFAWRPDNTSPVVRLRWFTGIVRESAWFDDDADNDSRIISGARLEYDRGDWLSAGAARTVMSGGGRGTLSAALQPFARRGREPVMELLSADLRFSARDAGSTAWLELVRQAPFEGVREFLNVPTEGIAFRGGLVQRLRRTASADWIGSLEFVRLDQSGSTVGDVPNDFYTDAAVIHGWTHRGQPLGAGIGPGGQRQFARLDRLGSTWRLGAFIERMRWNNDALGRQPMASSDRHDVTVQLGVVATRRVGVYDITARFSAGRRLNYLFQGPSSTPGSEPVDLGVLRAALSFKPAGVATRIVGVLPES